MGYPAGWTKADALRSAHRLVDRLYRLTRARGPVWWTFVTTVRLLVSEGEMGAVTRLPSGRALGRALAKRRV